MPVNTQINIRRDTAAAFTAANPTLALGEIAYETDTFRFKVGTGSTAWTALGYAAQNPTEISGNVPFTSTGAIKVPSGTFAQRPGSPTAGMIRHNTDNNRLEHYNGTAWQTFAPEVLEVEYLVVAGGGGGTSGNGNGGAGGGAGGFRTNVGGTPLILSSGSSYTVTIGAGGAAAQGVALGNSGTLSQFASVSSNGGGAGGLPASQDANGVSGGSGGGGGGRPTSPATGAGGAGNTPPVSPSQGNNGGNSATAALLHHAGGGGGGAGATGGNGVISVSGGNGGDGLASSISGSSVTYAGGGGGGYAWESGLTPYPGGTGGLGGGSRGAGNGLNTVNATANSGGGGGGGCYEDLMGVGQVVRGSSAGGSGIVIVRYLGPQRATGGTVTSSGGYSIHTFTTSGTFALVA